MRDPAELWHLICRLDGYGEARTLRHVARRHAAEGRPGHVVALKADPRIAAELTAAGVIVHVLGARWEYDPLSLGRLAALNRKRGAGRRLWHAWDDRSLIYARLATPRELLGRVALPGVVDLQSDAESQLVELRSELALEASTPLIATVGPLERRKHLDEAIWCYELVRVLHPAARLVIVGDGPDRERLERLALAISEPGCVRFLGYRDDVPAILPQVDMLWQLEPSRTTPCAVLEAMAAGAVVVATDAPGHRAAIHSGVSGLLTPLASRVEVARAADDLLNDPALAARVANVARLRVAGMRTLERALERFEGLTERGEARPMPAQLGARR